ncbi:cysteine hydrolase [Tahibacter amnicola]|uniref:Cysteine hydrolase n=1 Tax=Tahibacter amnicola TaxID=2976241 RepID=A0ABY6B6S8_9GAMM|nr:cysteine hydrolase [Tahibacter amnicola]UXI65811.1 cysteine hydrolase [Tahibacter amnicola]
MTSTPLRKPQDTHCACALLLIDWFSCWPMRERDQLLPRARDASRVAARLVQRARQRDVPVIFANDNFGHWRSDFRAVVDAAVEEGGLAAEIATRMAPDPGDYFVLKPKHSAYFGTPLDLLLSHLRTRTILIAGITTDQCVLATAIDGHIRDRRIVVVRDACAAATASRHKGALERIEAFGISAMNSRSVRWDRLAD